MIFIHELEQWPYGESYCGKGSETLTEIELGFRGENFFAKKKRSIAPLNGARRWIKERKEVLRQSHFYVVDWVHHG